MKDTFKQKWKKRRAKIYPQIKDWKDPQDYMRYRTDVKNMSLADWLWFSPDAFKIVYYGTPSLSILFFGAAFYLGARVIHNNTPLWLGTILILYFIRDLYKKIRKRKAIKDVNMYDIYLRDY